MKKIVYVFMIVAITLNFCACSSNSSSNSLDLETQYYNYAQQYINEGSIDQALKVLEEGIANIESKKLEELRNSLNEKEDDSTYSSSDDFTEYAGRWYAPELSQGNAGWVFELLLEIAVKNNDMAIVLQYSCDDPYDPENYQIAEIKKVVSLSEIKNGILSLNYEDDGLGNSGTLEFTFLKDRILCISNTTEIVNKDGEYYAGWGFFFETCVLTKEETAEELLK